MIYPDHIRPHDDGDDSAPQCVETCPSHDGKRCRVTGHRPDAICEPAVIEIRRRFARLLIDVQETIDSLNASQKAGTQ